MSDPSNAPELRKRFLKAAYVLGMDRPGRLVSLDEIAEEMQSQMDTSTPVFVQRLIDIARYLHEKGLIRRQTVSYEIISITSEGIDEVERELLIQSPASPNDENASERARWREEMQRRFLEAVYDLAGGSVNQFVYWQNVAPRLGYEPEAASDWAEASQVIDGLADLGFLRIESDERILYTITGPGIDEVEGHQPSSGFGMPAWQVDRFTSDQNVEEAPLHIRESLQRFRKDPRILTR